MARNAVVTDAAAISSGTTASSEAKTKASTASAPSAPITISSSTPGPPAEPPVLVSGVIPVTCTCEPAGR
jgi:hypothetical protein